MATENEDSVLSLEGTEQSSDQPQVTEQGHSKILPKPNGHSFPCLIIVLSQTPTPRLTNPVSGPAAALCPLPLNRSRFSLAKWDGQDWAVRRARW